MTAIPRNNDNTARCRPACSNASGSSSEIERNAMIPPTAASSFSTSWRSTFEGKNRARTTTASGSARPDTAAYRKPRVRLPVAKYTGSATATPSGTLCSAMAKASEAPTACDFMEARNTATPSGKLCSAMPTAVMRPESNTRRLASRRVARSRAAVPLP
ncbi:hypothetical protein Vafri_7541, partial [Volvox africanus]